MSVNSTPFDQMFFTLDMIQLYNYCRPLLGDLHSGIQRGTFWARIGVWDMFRLVIGWDWYRLMDVACPAWSEATLNVYSLPLANQLAADIQCYIKDFSNEEPVQVVSRRWLASHVSSTARLLLQADKQTIRPIFASEGFITACLFGCDL